MIEDLRVLLGLPEEIDAELENKLLRSGGLPVYGVVSAGLSRER